MNVERCVPRLVRRVRLRWDGVRGAHVILFPEGVLVLNATAAAILCRVDGVRTVAEIAAGVRAEHPEAAPATVMRDVEALLERVCARGFLELAGVEG